MYGQHLGVRPDAPGQPIFIPNFARGFVSRVCFLVLSFRKIGRKNVGSVGIEISSLPLKRHIAYTTACNVATAQVVIMLFTE